MKARRPGNGLPSLGDDPSGMIFFHLANRILGRNRDRLIRNPSSNRRGHISSAYLLIHCEKICLTPLQHRDIHKEKIFHRPDFWGGIVMWKRPPGIGWRHDFGLWCHSGSGGDGNFFGNFNQPGVNLAPSVPKLGQVRDIFFACAGGIKP